MKKYLADIRQILKSKIYVFSLLAIALISFGYAAFNTSLSIDDTESDRYVGSGNGMLAAGRFGIWLWSFIQGNWENSFTIDLFAVFMFAFACINFSLLFKRISHGKIGLGALTIFSCVFLSYPLMNEIWEYTGAGVNVCGGFCLVSLSLLMIHSFLHQEKGKKGFLLLLPPTLMLMLVCAGYEAVVPVYVFFVFAILALQIIYGEEKEKRFWEIIKQGSLYAGLLALGLILRFLVHKLILILCNIEASPNGATEIVWGTKPVREILGKLCDDFFVHYIFRAVIYFPLTILAISIVVFLVMGIAACKKKGAILLIPGAGMLLSLILLSLIQGVYSPYRICQVFGAFCAFTAMMLISCFPKNETKTKTIFRNCCIFLCALLSFYQASFLNYFFELNHRRSENEEAVIRQISYDLQKDFDEEKPVIFVGSYTGNSAIFEEASIPEDSFRWKTYEKLCTKYFALRGNGFDPEILSRKLPVNNVCSVINWGLVAFNTQDCLARIFSYYGYDYVPADYDAYLETANAESSSMPVFPKEGYIQDMGEYLIVHIG